MSKQGDALLHKWHIKRPSVAVAIPMTWALHREAIQNHLHVAKSLRGNDHLILRAETAVVSQTRNWAIREFLALPRSVEWLFFFDDDMVVPANIIDYMTLRANLSDSAFLSGVCTTKTPPYLPTVYVKSQLPEPTIATGQEHFGRVSHQYHSVTDLDVSGKGPIAPVDGTGAACLCLRRDLLEAIPAPWFAFEESGEDLYFCRKVLEAGYQVRVDQSILVGHVGIATVGAKEWDIEKDDWLAANGGQKPIIELKRTG